MQKESAIRASGISKIVNSTEIYGENHYFQVRPYEMSKIKKAEKQRRICFNCVLFHILQKYLVTEQM